MGQRGEDLLVDTLVRLTEHGAALGVAEDDVAAEALEHGRGDFAGVGAAGFVVHVLRADADSRPGQGLGHGGDGDEGRANGDVDAVDGVQFGGDLVHKSNGGVGRLVHLPVAGNEWGTHDMLVTSLGWARRGGREGVVVGGP